MDDDENDAIWEYATQDVKPIKRAKRLTQDVVITPPPPKIKKRVTFKKFPSESVVPDPVAAVPKAEKISEPNAGMDRRTEERLRKGLLPIEARVDLHGHTREEARGILQYFVQGAYQKGQRCLLVITGKGSSDRGLRDPLSSGDGVLKQNVPLWLHEPPLSPLVLRVFPARPKDGGSGALYVYLRKAR